MADLRTLRCQTHGDREAVAKCRRCEAFYCRECIVEHEGRMTCTICLREATEETPAEKKSRRRLQALLHMVALGIGLLVSWLFFILLGNILLWIKDGFTWADSL
jgi:hypothetical protein